MQTLIGIEAVPYTSRTEKRDAVRKFREEYPYAAITVSDGLVMCERMFSENKSAFAY